MHEPSPPSSSLARASAIPVPRLRRLLFFALVLATATAGVAVMSDILNANGMTLLEGLVLALFTYSFTWISLSFWNAAAGFVLQALRLDPHSLRRRTGPVDRKAPITARTAVVMPVFNEEVARVIAGLEATCRSLSAEDDSGHFDFFLLSDSTDPEIASAEERAFHALRERLDAEGHLFYRRRQRNTGRKPGNISEFCRRWGAHYDFMIVLDADSVMSGEAMLDLVRAMQDAPDAGLIQTVPIPVRQETPFGRFLQFGASLYAPMLSVGSCFWQTDTSNFWGHNAILRVRAFMDHCGLPVLPGEPPLGGEILSHDFVEAALLRRGGWRVHLAPDIRGSFEEVPGNLLDYAKRDRRWAQGNLQHLRLLSTYGLHPLSRIHFLMGATAYLSSLAWLLLLLLGSADAFEKALAVPHFFGASYQLFPDWPIAKSGEIALLLAVTMATLFLPKIFGTLLALASRERRRLFGGAGRLCLGAASELLLSVLIAPLMMLFHAGFVLSILLGGRIGWTPQSRGARRIGLGRAARQTLLPALLGAGWGAAAYLISPLYFYALSPVVIGLLLSAPLVSWTSSPAAGRRLRRLGVFQTPEETETPNVLSAMAPPPASAASRPATADDVAADPGWMPLELPGEMPVQSFETGSHWKWGTAQAWGLSGELAPQPAAATVRSGRGRQV